VATRAPVSLDHTSTPSCKTISYAGKPRTSLARLNLAHRSSIQRQALKRLRLPKIEPGKPRQSRDVMSKIGAPTCSIQPSIIFNYRKRFIVRKHTIFELITMTRTKKRKSIGDEEPPSSSKRTSIADEEPPSKHTQRTQPGAAKRTIDIMLTALILVANKP
jgi:hypothetical protein